MISDFRNFINEKLKIEKMDSYTLSKIKDNLVDRLNEYKESILSNIKYDIKTNKISYEDFENIDISVMLRELKNEFTNDVVDELNVETFLRKIHQILDLKKRNTKKLIIEE